MLNPQVIMNLLPELRVGVDLTGRDRRAGERFASGAGWLFPLVSSLSALRSETNEFHKCLSILG